MDICQDCKQPALECRCSERFGTDATRACLVRDAMRAMAVPGPFFDAWYYLATSESDANLAKLGRMLK